MFNQKRSPYLEEDDGLNIGGGNDVTEDVVASDTTDDVEGGKDTDNSQADVKPIQNHEDNEKFKAARIEAEKKTSQRYESEREADAKALGYNSYAEYKQAITEHSKQQEEQQRLNYIEQNGFDPNAINSLIQQGVDNHPLIQSVKQQQTQKFIDDQVSELARDFPESGIKSAKDLFSLPNYEDIYQKVSKGYSIADAYASVNRNEILQKRTAAASQRTMNNINGKSHIKPDGGGIDLDNIKIDEEEFENAKGLNKKLTRDEWTKFKKTQRS